MPTNARVLGRCFPTKIIEAETNHKGALVGCARAHHVTMIAQASAILCSSALATRDWQLLPVSRMVYLLFPRLKPWLFNTFNAQARQRSPPNLRRSLSCGALLHQMRGKRSQGYKDTQGAIRLRSCAPACPHSYRPIRCRDESRGVVSRLTHILHPSPVPLPLRPPFPSSCDRFFFPVLPFPVYSCPNHNRI